MGFLERLALRALAFSRKLLESTVLPPGEPPKHLRRKAPERTPTARSPFRRRPTPARRQRIEIRDLELRERELAVREREVSLAEREKALQEPPPPRRRRPPAENRPPGPSYPRLLAGSRSAVAPENLRNVYSQERIAREAFALLLFAGVPPSMMALWQTRADHIELYVKVRS